MHLLKTFHKIIGKQPELVMDCSTEPLSVERLFINMVQMEIKETTNEKTF